jgi:hypothetical protein
MLVKAVTDISEDRFYDIRRRVKCPERSAVSDEVPSSAVVLHGGGTTEGR